MKKNEIIKKELLEQWEYPNCEIQEKAIVKALKDYLDLENAEQSPILLDLRDILLDYLNNF